MIEKITTKVVAIASSLALALAFAPAVPTALAAGGYQALDADDPYSIEYKADFDVEDDATASDYTFKVTSSVSVVGGGMVLSLQSLNTDGSAFEDTGMSKVRDGFNTISAGQVFTTQDFPNMTHSVAYRLVVTPASSSGEPNGQPLQYSGVFTLAERQAAEEASSAEPEASSGEQQAGATDTSTSAGATDASPSSNASEEVTVKSYAAPRIEQFTVVASMLYATATVEIDHGATNYSDGTTSVFYGAYIELYNNGKCVAKSDLGTGTSARIGCSIRYGKKDKLYVKVYNYKDGKKYGSAAKSKTIKKKSSKLGKPSNVRATKISSKKAIVRWDTVFGATGYNIYKGSKKVKQVKGTASKYTAKGSGAGSAKYKVQAIVKSKLDKKTFKGSKSKAAKPGKNEVTWDVDTYYKNYKYGTCPFQISKISLSGKTYTITGYACNNRMWDMKKYEHLGINVTVDGKTVAKKLLKNKAVGAKEYTVKKVTLKIKGKAGADLRNGSAYSNTYDVRPYWVSGSGSRIG